MGPVKVCPECDIAGCYHIRAQEALSRENHPEVYWKVDLKEDPWKITDLGILRDQAERLQKRLDLQRRVLEWFKVCFGEDEVNHRKERAFRFLEEALELVQALGVTTDEIATLVGYTYGRPVGEASQEVGGVVTTLMILSEVHQIDALEMAEKELERIWERIEIIRQKNLTKPKASPLPGTAPSNT